MLLVPIAFCRAPGHGRFLACQWALSLRFPAEDLRGLAPETLMAFTHARAEAFWRDGQLIGLTSGYRDAAQQHRIFAEEVRRTGSVLAARSRVLPPPESSHVRGLALDVRPTEGARWLERHGGRYGLYRVYDNEWWHFEYRTVEPVRLPHPGAAAWPPQHRAAYGPGQIYGNEPWRHEPRPDAADGRYPPMYADPAEDPRMRP
ncbi:M15 family metallopeptidase [Actinomadura opuntiae]|uniref:M15 family metallopeptidase n=1 Tax=Actinomadura sp. OS1-43 TaxID=604315 RepID=UPI00255B182B|nr:M15 family metallopeptidase [Actinomadura sp. OS1-43]MDL4818688.1 M15 family metallopeptidase [Actinomadura sp. OS1-43]